MSMYGAISESFVYISDENDDETNDEKQKELKTKCWRSKVSSKDY